MGGRFGQLATRYWVSAGYVPRFTPPEGSFVNFLAQMANTVLRSRREKRCATAQPAPAARIALPSRNTRAIEISTVLSHDLWWIPTRLAKKIYVGARSKGCYRRENFVPPAVTTQLIGPSIDVAAFQRTLEWRAPRGACRGSVLVVHTVVKGACVHIGWPGAPAMCRPSAGAACGGRARRRQARSQGHRHR